MTIREYITSEAAALRASVAQAEQEAEAVISKANQALQAVKDTAEAKAAFRLYKIGLY